MKRPIVLLILSLCAATPGGAASGDFTTDRPSPLQLVKPRGDHGGGAQFSGSVRLAGKFLLAWQTAGRTRPFLHVRFLPDGGSAALLPRMAADPPVKELLFSNPEKAVTLLLDPDAAQRFLAKEIMNASGQATVTIRGYQISVACDQRWYSAELMSAAREHQILAGARETIPEGCG